MQNTEIFFWSDRAEHAYAVLRYRSNHHWQLEWGYRDPPASGQFIRRGAHETSEREAAVQQMLDRIRALSPEPSEALSAERKLQETLRELHEQDTKNP